MTSIKRERGECPVYRGYIIERGSSSGLYYVRRFCSDHVLQMAKTYDQACSYVDLLIRHMRVQA